MKFLLACAGSVALVMGFAIVLGLLTEGPAWVAALTGGGLVWLFRGNIQEALDRSKRRRGL